MSSNNPIGSTSVSDMFLNAGNLDKALNGNQDTWIDRFGVERVSWNYIEKVTKTGELSKQAREALRRSYAEAGLNMVNGSFEKGGILVNANDVLLHEATGKCYSGNPGTVAPGTLPTSGGFVDKSITEFLSVQDLASSTRAFKVGDLVSTGLTNWIAGQGPKGIPVGEVRFLPIGGFVELIDCGVIFDGVTDNAATLNFSATLSLPIKLSSGEVGTTSTHTFNASIVGPGSKKCGFVNLDTSQSKTYLITIQNTTEPCYGFSVDGSSSAFQGTKNQDPVEWTSSNYDTWYGTRGLLFKNCPDIAISDIIGKNSARFSCIRLEECDNVSLSFCHAKRSRGNFGDGFYHVGCVGVKYNFCTSWDTTRIGFVSEGESGTLLISNCIKYISCNAGRAHDGSINYGGNEYACGFWSENTDNVDYTLCETLETEHAGFIWAPTTPSNATMYSREANYSQCRVVSSNFGFMTTPLSNGAKNVANYSLCSASGITSQAFLNRPATGIQSYSSYHQCHAGMIGTGANCIAFSPETGSVGSLVDMKIDDCSSTWENITRLGDSLANTADIGQFLSKGVANVQVNNLKNKTTDSVYLKNNSLLASNYSYHFKSSEMNIIANIEAANDVELSGSVSGLIKGQKIYLDNITVPETKSLSLLNGLVYGKAKLINSRLLVTHELGKYPDTKKVVGEVDLIIERNVAVDDYGLRVLFEQAGSKPTFIVNGIFYNTGPAAASNKNFIWAPRDGTLILTKGVLNDNTVSHIYRINGTAGNFATAQQNVLMH